MAILSLSKKKDCLVLVVRLRR